MDKGLRKSIDKFYDEKEELDVFGLVDVASSIVPRLDLLVTRLQEENERLYGKLNMISDIIEKGRDEN